MSIDMTGKEIGRFLKSTQPEVLCLKGKWGVGKTFAWQRFILDARSKGEIGLGRYAFVSLYGVSSADELRVSIVENTIKREQIGQEIDLQSILSDPLNSAQSGLRKLLAKIGYVPWGQDIAALIQHSSFLAVRNQVICLDDLERKGDALKIKEVLGLATFLKEQRGCKVVLILNDGAFEGDEKDDFKMFFEKTVDSHVIFAPSAEEAAQIALPDGSELHKTMRAHCVTLGISNIRVIRRIERMANLLKSMLAGLHPQVFQDYLRDLVVLGWCKYGEEAPPLEFVKARRSPSYTGTKEKSDDEKKWGELLDRHGLRYFSATSMAVIEGLDQGFFDASAVLPAAKKLNEGYVAQQSESDFHEAWQIYHRGFGDDETKLVETLSESFRKNIPYISPMNANGTVVLLKDLGYEPLAKELIELYVAGRDAHTFDSLNMSSDNDITDDEFNDAVKKKLGEVVDSRNPKDVLLKISRQRGWDRSDIVLLSKVSADDFVKIFKSIDDSDDLSSSIRMALGFGKFGGDGEAGKALSKNATDALVKIGTESSLNRRRVGKYGIKLD